MTAFNFQRATFKASLVVLAFISYTSLDVDGFIVSWKERRTRIHTSSSERYSSYHSKCAIQSRTRSLLVRVASSTTAQIDTVVNDHQNNLLDLSRYANVYAFNRALDDLASQCLDDKPNQHRDVISIATLAEALVSKLEQHPTDATFEPDVVSYNTLIKVWARVAQCLSEGRGRADVHETFHSEYSIPPEFTQGAINSARDAAVRATSILEGLEMKYLKGQSSFGPDVQGYNTVLESWIKCRCKDGAERCEEMLHKMQQSSHTSPKVSQHGAEGVKPNSLTYALCIDALMNIEETEDTISKILSLERALELEYNSTKEASMKPDIRIGNRIINAHGKSNFLNKRGPEDSEEGEKRNAIPWHAARKAHEVFTVWNKRYKSTGDEDYKPDAMSFSSVLDAYARCGDKNSIDKAQQLFDFMMKEWKESGDDRVKPSSRTFTSIVTAWSKSMDPSAPLKTEALLEMMEDLYNKDVENGLKTVSLLKPNIRTYTAAISAWGNSKDPSKPQRALRILKKCIDEHKRTGNEEMKPNLYTYNCCISACSRLDGATFEQTSQALKIAFSVNKAISAASLEPNHFTYATLLKAVTNLLATGPERDEVAEALFSKCAKTGYVETGVLKNLRLAASNSLYHRLLNSVTDKNGVLNIGDIPKEWSRKVNAI